MANPPFISPVFQIVAGVLEYKPYVDFPTWLPVWDLTGLLTDVDTNAIDEIKARQPDHFEIMTDEFIWTSGTKVYAVSNFLPYNWLAFSTTNTAVAQRTIQCRAGKYTINILTQKDSARARLDMGIDGTTILSALDLYAPSANNTFIHTLTNVAINSNIDHVLVIAANGHNASSSGYTMGISKIWGYRTGA